MQHFFMGKTFWLYSIIVILILSIFSFAQFGPSSTSKVRHLKVALVNEDSGSQGQKIVRKLHDAFKKKDSVIKWKTVSSVKKVHEGFNQKKYYAAVIIPQNFSDKLATLTTATPHQATLKFWINQGMNAEASTIFSTLFDKLGTRLNQGMSTKIMQGMDMKLQVITMKMQQASLSAVPPKPVTPLQAAKIKQIAKAQQAAKATALKTITERSKQTSEVLGHPIKTEIKLFHKIGTHSAGGNAPVLFTMLAWLGGLVCSLLLWRAFKKMGDGALSLKLVSGQLLAGFVLSIIESLTLWWVVGGMMNVPVPNGGTFVMALSLSAFVFFLIQTAVLDWLGFGGWPIVLLIWFYGSPLLPYPPEMLNGFFRYGIYSWVPVRFGMEAIKDVLYFGSRSDFSTMITILSLIGAGALLLVFGSGYFQQLRRKRVGDQPV